MVNALIILAITLAILAAFIWIPAELRYRRLLRKHLEQFERVEKEITNTRNRLG